MWIVKCLEFSCFSKKHNVETKEEMDVAIGLSRPAKDAPAVNADAEAAGVDTVCRHCGEDFKFYRSLKHHLRSQSSCSHKPFTCRDCSIGFSTKANCLRHIQKQHSAVAGVSVESRMVVNETLLAAQMKAAAASESRAYGPTNLRKRGLETNDRQSNKVRRLDIMSLVNGSHKMKQEQTEISCDDQPLDFSLKTMNSQSSTPYGAMLPQSAGEADEPMDLSIGAARSSCRPAVLSQTSEFDSSSPISLVVASRHASPSSRPAAITTASSAGMTQYRWSVMAPMLQCTHCRAVFKHSSKVQRRSLRLLCSSFLSFPTFLLLLTVTPY